MASGRTCFAPSRATHSSISSVPDALAADTDLKRDTGKTEDGLCDRIQLRGVNVLLVFWGELTSAKTAPYLIALSTTLSVGASIIGECSVNNPSSSSSNKSRDFTYADIISLMRWTINCKETNGSTRREM